MEFNRRSSFTLILCLFLALPAFAGGPEPLTLRVSDAIAAPGGLAAVVIRTYASRPVGSGQLCFEAAGRCFGLRRAACRGALGNLLDYSPGANVAGYVVFSEEGDAQSWVGDGENLLENLMLGFDSPSATVNRSDGPLAVVFLRVPANAEPAVGLQIDFDLANTVLFDELGRQVPIEARPGVIKIRSPLDPYTLEADGDRIRPGAVASLSVETFEPKALTGGRVVLTYDPAIAARAPTVRFDPRYGHSSFTADTATAGRIVVDFSSPDATLNWVPGPFLQIDLPTRGDIAPGTESPIALVAEETHLVSSTEGRRLALNLGAGATIEFE